MGRKASFAIACSTERSVTVCCNALRCIAGVAVCGSVLQCVVVYCSEILAFAIACSTESSVREMGRGGGGGGGGDETWSLSGC